MSDDALYLEDLTSMRCADPDCKDRSHGVILTPKCHPRGGTNAQINIADGTLDIYCAKCRRFVCDVKIASRRPVS